MSKVVSFVHVKVLATVDINALLSNYIQKCFTNAGKIKIDTKHSILFYSLFLAF